MATNRLSEQQAELLSLLRSKMIGRTKVHTIQWPSYIGVKSLGSSIINRKVCFHLGHQAVTSNMQTDASSFEGWAVVVFSWLKEGKGVQVEMSWDDPGGFDLNSQQQRNQYRHYQRYLYRVIRFREMFDWFVVAPESESLLSESQVLFPDGRLKEKSFFLNSGQQEIRNKTSIICDKAFGDLSEDCLEMLFIHNKNSLMQCAFGNSAQTLMRQFPVGVFKGEVTNNCSISGQGMPIFTGGKSAIDLWAVGNGRAAIFELKKPSGNKKVGIVSELIFYANIVRDLQLKNLKYKNPKPFEAQLIDSVGVDSYFLLGEGNIHPLLNSKAIFDCLNDSGRKRDIKFDIIYYNNLLECRKEDWKE